MYNIIRIMYAPSYLLTLCHTNVSVCLNFNTYFKNFRRARQITNGRKINPSTNGHRYNHLIWYYLLETLFMPFIQLFRLSKVLQFELTCKDPNEKHTYCYSSSIQCFSIFNNLQSMIEECKSNSSK